MCYPFANEGSEAGAWIGPVAQQCPVARFWKPSYSVRAAFKRAPCDRQRGAR